MISRRIRLARTTASFAAISSTCQFIANWVRAERARAPVASYPKGAVMERLLEFLNDEAW